jgi:hypothetical protein
MQMVPGVVVPTYNPSTRLAEAGGSWVQSQPGLHSVTLSQKKKKTCKVQLTPVCCASHFPTEQSLDCSFPQDPLPDSTGWGPRCEQRAGSAYLDPLLPVPSVFLAGGQPSHSAFPMAHVVPPLAFVYVSRLVTVTRDQRGPSGYLTLSNYLHDSNLAGHSGAYL